MKWILVPVALGSLAFITPAFAQDADYGFYGGVALGKSSVDARSADSITYIPPDLSAISTNSPAFASEDLAWSTFVGYGAVNGLGVELGFWDHGDIKSTLMNSSDASISVNEWYLGGTVAYPLFGPLSLTGGAGLSRAQFDTSGTFRVVTGTASLPIATPDDETGGYWRVGISAHFDRLEAGLAFVHRDLGAFELSSAAIALSYLF
jgi:hypothetical protein